MDVEFYIEQFTHELFNTADYADNFLLEVRAAGTKYEVFIDGDTGVTVDKCRKVSRYLEQKLEEEGHVDGKYTLEVSSPGATRPLTIWRQYGKHKGRTLKVSKNDGSTVKGKLTELGEEALTLTEKQKSGTVEHEIPFADIKESVVQISFN